MKAKSERQSIIKSLVIRERIRNQEQLIGLLREEGMMIAQATLSRDLNELGITKVHDSEGYRFRLPTAAEAIYSRSGSGDAGISNVILSVEFSGSLCVIKTHPGHASMITTLVDGTNSKSVAGTIAGDDTILAVMREGYGPSDMLEDLAPVFGNINQKIINQ